MLFGPPEEILSDQGKEFLNEVVDQLSKNVGVKRKVTSSYHPRTNGLTERFNQTLVNSLRKFAEDDPLSWDKWIPFILLSYRSKEHSRTNYTPFELILGRKMNSFENWSIDSTISEDEAISNRAREIKELVEKQAHAIEAIESNKENQIQTQNKSKNVEVERLEIGTQVFVQSKGLLTKLEPRYHGPYTISGLTRLGNYWLKNKYGTELKQSVPRSRLKLVITEDQRLKAKEIMDSRKQKGSIEYLVKLILRAFNK